MNSCSVSIAKYKCHDIITAYNIIIVKSAIIHVKVITTPRSVSWNTSLLTAIVDLRPVQMAHYKDVVFVLFYTICCYTCNLFLSIKSFVIYIIVPLCRYFATGSADALTSLWDVSEFVCLRTFTRLELSTHTHTHQWVPLYCGHHWDITKCPGFERFHFTK